MTRLRGAPALLGLYAALLLLPPSAAVVLDPFADARPALLEASAALALIAVPLTMAQFALVSRLRTVSQPFGTDALIQWHQYVGMITLAVAVLHPLLLHLTGLPWNAWNPAAGTAATRSGVAAVTALALLALTTLARARLRLSYESWRGTHMALAFMAAGALAVHVVTAGGYTRVWLVKAICLLDIAGFAAVVVQYRLFRPVGLRRRPWEVVENRDEGASIRTLRLSPRGHAGIAFAPGQFAWLITGASPWSSQQHPLSISSSAAAGPGALEFSIKALGDWSSGTVPGLARGTRVWVDGPFGAFTIDRAKAAPGVVFIAGGIGIAPIRSMLLTMSDRRDPRPAVLFYAAHDDTRLAFVEELARLRETMALSIVYVLENPAGRQDAEAGHLSVPTLQRHLPQGFRDHAFFVCGPLAMMDAAEHMLLDMGVPRRNIDTERFQVV